MLTGLKLTKEVFVQLIMAVSLLGRYKPNLQIVAKFHCRQTSTKGFSRRSGFLFPFWQVGHIGSYNQMILGKITIRRKDYRRVNGPKSSP